MLASGFVGGNQSVAVDEATSTTAITATTTANLNNNKNYNLGAEVRKFVSDRPLMVEISRCESQFRQYEKDGSVLRGRVNNMDVGIFQINEYYHLERSNVPWVEDRGKKKEVRSLNARMLVKVLQGGTDVIISYLEKV